MINLPKDDLKKQDILQRIAKKFEKNKEYSEKEVNKVIKSFDVDDHVLIRRELINFNYLGKDSYRDIYWVKDKRLNKDKLEIIKHNMERIKKSGFY